MSGKPTTVKRMRSPDLRGMMSLSSEGGATIVRVLVGTLVGMLDGMLGSALGWVAGLGGGRVAFAAELANTLANKQRALAVVVVIQGCMMGLGSRG